MLEAVIFDWAGTVVDHGSLAPVSAFRRLFEERGVALSAEEIRGPMGTEKRDHICQLLEIRTVAESLTGAAGGRLADEEVDRLYARLSELTSEEIVSRSALIPGTLSACKDIRARKLKVGTTTGYSSGMVKGLVDMAKEAGFEPDLVVAADDVPLNRPAASGALKNALDLGVRAVRNCVKVDDTRPGIDEGINAGMWTVGVVVSGNALGLSEAEWQSAEDKEPRYQAAYAAASEFGAHYLIDSVASLPDVLDDIESRLAGGEKP